MRIHIVEYLNFNWFLISLFVFSIIYSPMVGSFIPIPGIKMISLGIFVIGSVVVLLVRRGLSIPKYMLFYALISTALLFLSLFFWGGISTPGSYISIVLVFLVFALKVEQQFESLIRVTLLITVLIALLEYVSGSYLYVVETVVNGELFVLDEKLFSGGLDIFRSKGVFEGPLTMAQFCVFIALMFFKDKKVIIIALVGAGLTASRMAIFVVLSIFIFSIYISPLKGGSKFERIVKRSGIFAVIVIFLVSLASYLVLSTSDFAVRLAQTFDFSSSDSNQLRLYFWANALVTFTDYSFSNVLFGDNGLYRSIYSNNAESGWLTLLVDNGLLGLFLYSIPCFYILYKGFFKKKFDLAFGAFVYLIVNSAMTFYLSASGNVLYWYLIFVWIRRLKYEN